MTDPGQIALLQQGVKKKGARVATTGLQSTIGLWPRGNRFLCGEESCLFGGTFSGPNSHVHPRLVGL
jgi:hypothetical protein